jgi:uncharacterized membrane protein YhaH (DUF805 family)
MRPFWMHQVVEYIIGAVFISIGFGSPTPAVPAALGALVMLNAAIAAGPAAAFQLVHRRIHRILDLVVVGLIAVAAVQPWVDIEAGTRLIIALLGVVLAFVWWNTDFATKDQRKQRRRQTPTPDAEAVGRSAGRSAAETYLAAKRLKKAVIDDRRDGASEGDSKPADGDS